MTQGFLFQSLQECLDVFVNSLRIFRIFVFLIFCTSSRDQVIAKTSKIMAVARLRHVELPHDKKERWLKLKDLYSRLEGVQTANYLAAILQRIFEEANNDIQKLAHDRSKDAVDSFGPKWHFKGLELFLDEIATEEESETFFKSTLPFIVTLAASIEEFAPSEGILLCSQQQGM